MALAEIYPLIKATNIGLAFTAALSSFVMMVAIARTHDPIWLVSHVGPGYARCRTDWHKRGPQHASSVCPLAPQRRGWHCLGAYHNRVPKRRLVKR
jgi:hypothetical protein